MKEVKYSTVKDFVTGVIGLSGIAFLFFLFLGTGFGLTALLTSKWYIILFIILVLWLFLRRR